jgi:ubiquinone/menaquinone biosynthesis C-methylase UbiE
MALAETESIKKDVMKRYDTEANRGKLTPDFAKSYRDNLIKMLIMKLRTQKEHFVADLGCGTGIYSTICSENGSQYVGIDLSRKMIKACLRTNTQASWIVGDCERVPLSNDSISIVLSISTIELLPNPRKAVEEMRRIIQHNGRSLVVIPNFRSLHYIFWRAVDKIFLEGELFQNKISLEGLADELKRNGFKVTKQGGFLLLPLSLINILPKFLQKMMTTIDKKCPTNVLKDIYSYLYIIAEKQD